MARVTVEDCLDKIPNRFDLVVLASRRARDLTLGRAPFIERENDKATVIALREIAEGKIDLDYLNVQEASPVDLLGKPEPDSDHGDASDSFTGLMLDDVEEAEEADDPGEAGKGGEDAGDEDEGEPGEELEAPVDEGG